MTWLIAKVPELVDDDGQWGFRCHEFKRWKELESAQLFEELVGCLLPALTSRIVDEVSNRFKDFFFQKSPNTPSCSVELL